MGTRDGGSISLSLYPHLYVFTQGLASLRAPSEAGAFDIRKGKSGSSGGSWRIGTNSESCILGRFGFAFDLPGGSCTI